VFVLTEPTAPAWGVVKERKR